jgi:hypothetical protein
MMRTRLLALIAAIAISVVAAPVARVDVPERLTDAAFWKLSADASEPGGYFRSQDITNLTSNELGFQLVIPELVRRTRPGGVYLGVGPEQNFTYIAAVRPAMAIIFDIRRGNLDLQLMYKAIFELSRDRADFVGMLFGRPRLTGVGPNATARDLFRALAQIPPSESVFRRHLAAIEQRLSKTHALPMRPADLAGVRTIYETFYYSGVGVRAFPTYADLMGATDADGVNRGFLANEDNFMFVRNLELRNMIVPVVGDFAGPKALRAVGAYLTGQHAVVSAFYLSNVEQYLGDWSVFCRNVRTFPLDGSSTFIRSTSGGGFGRGGGFISSLGAMAEEARSCGG